MGEALVNAHRGPWAAVGPVVANANPGSLVSWADFVIGYGPWAEPMKRGEAPFLPGHNSSYKRDVLLGYGDRLEEMLQAETVLHYDLRGPRAPAAVCAGARTRHVNFSRISTWARVQLRNGRVFAAVRAEDWSPARRAAYAVASPLIPLVRLARSAGPVRRWRGVTGGPSAPCRWSALGLVLDGVGQAARIRPGRGGVGHDVARYEYRRIDHVREADRAVFAPPPPPDRTV